MPHDPEKAAKLTAYATIYRYPGLAFSPTPEEAVDAQVLAREVFVEILAQLPAEAHPAQ